jgi:colanic acid/amylovoran biosynthesis glycosyltransferase
VVLCRKKLNPGSFPHGDVYSIEDLNASEWLYNFLIFKSMGYFPYFNKQHQYHCDLLHAHFGYNAFKSVGLSKALKKPLICSFYGGDVFKYPAQPAHRANYRKLFREFSKGIVLGPYMKNTLVDLGCPDDKLVINHLGVDVDKITFHPREVQKEKPFRFLIASSFVEKKGIDIALTALKKLEKDSDFIVELVGDGPLKPKIIALIRELKMENKVVLHGYKSYDYFLNLAGQCDGYIQASKTAADNDKEGTPMAIIDVMASGMPVVATYHSDIPETVEDGITGYLAEENDSDSLSEALKKMVNSGKDYAAMSHRCRVKIENEFNIRKQVDRLEKIYAEIS